MHLFSQLAHEGIKGWRNIARAGQKGYIEALVAKAVQVFTNPCKNVVGEAAKFMYETETRDDAALAYLGPALEILFSVVLVSGLLGALGLPTVTLAGVLISAARLSINALFRWRVGKLNARADGSLVSGSGRVVVPSDQTTAFIVPPRTVLLMAARRGRNDLIRVATGGRDAALVASAMNVHRGTTAFAVERSSRLSNILHFMVVAATIVALFLAAVFGIDPRVVVAAVVLLALAWHFAHARATLVVGADGIRFESFFSSKFVPVKEIESAVERKDYLGRYCVSLSTKNAIATLYCIDRALVEVLLLAIAGLTETRDGRIDIADDEWAPRHDGARAWIARVRRAARAVGYREPSRMDQVAERLARADAAPEERIAAAVALMEVDRVHALRIREEARALVNPRLRVALEQIADQREDAVIEEAINAAVKSDD